MLQIKWISDTTAISHGYDDISCMPIWSTYVYVRGPKDDYRHKTGVVIHSNVYSDEMYEAGPTWSYDTITFDTYGNSFGVGECVSHFKTRSEAMIEAHKAIEKLYSEVIADET